MSNKTCFYCRKENPNRTCGLCEKDVCKKCGNAFAPDSLEFLSPLPAALTHTFYCPDCFETEVEPACSRYQEQLALAKEMPIWSKNYRGTIPVLKKGREPIAVLNVSDKDKATLALAFKATELGFNGLSHVTIEPRKVRENNDPKGYQKTLWSAHGLPIMIDAEKLAREEERETRWRELHHR